MHQISLNAHYNKNVASSLLEVTSALFRVSLIDKEVDVLQIG
jgi:hypothetical protein